MTTATTRTKGHTINCSDVNPCEFHAREQQPTPRPGFEMYLVVNMDKIAQNETRSAIQWHGESKDEALEHAAWDEDLLVFAVVPESVEPKEDYRR